MAHGIRHVVVMGVSGSGKTTVARELAAHLGRVVADADDFHPEANIVKMRSGRPLDDADRWPWLETLAAWIAAHEARGEATVLACSALRHAYRDVLRRGAPEVGFVHLTGPPDVLAARMRARDGHFMPADLLASQLDTLEDLAPAEVGLTLDVRGTPEELAMVAATWASAPPAGRRSGSRSQASQS